MTPGEGAVAGNALERLRCSVEAAPSRRSSRSAISTRPTNCLSRFSIASLQTSKHNRTSVPDAGRASCDWTASLLATPRTTLGPPSPKKEGQATLSQDVNALCGRADRAADAPRPATAHASRCKKPVRGSSQYFSGVWARVRYEDLGRHAGREGQIAGALERLFRDPDVYRIRGRLLGSFGHAVG